VKNFFTGTTTASKGLFTRNDGAHTFVNGAAARVNGECAHDSNTDTNGQGVNAGP